MLPQGRQPVLGSPAGGVRRIDDDHRQPGVGGHLDQPVAKFPGGDAGDGAPEAPAAGGPVAGPFASFGAGLVEVEVLDDDGAGATGFRGGDQGADGGAQVPVAGGRRQPGQAEGNGGRDAQDVAVRRDDRGGEMTVVDVDSYYRAAPQVVQGRRGGRGGLPRGVDVPAVAGRVVGDVVADGAAVGLGGDLVAAVGERDGAGQPVAAVRPVGERGERGGQLDLQPAFIGVNADRFPTLGRPRRRRSRTAGPIPTAAATGPGSGLRRRGCRANKAMKVSKIASGEASMIHSALSACPSRCPAADR
jgi:hypothetical protein